MAKVNQNLINKSGKLHSRKESIKNKTMSTGEEGSQASDDTVSSPPKVIKSTRARVQDSEDSEDSEEPSPVKAKRPFRSQAGVGLTLAIMQCVIDRSSTPAEKAAALLQDKAGVMSYRVYCKVMHGWMESGHMTTLDDGLADAFLAYDSSEVKGKESFSLAITIHPNQFIDPNFLFTHSNNLNNFPAVKQALFIAHVHTYIQSLHHHPLVDWPHNIIPMTRVSDISLAKRASRLSVNKDLHAVNGASACTKCKHSTKPMNGRWARICLTSDNVNRTACICCLQARAHCLNDVTGARWA